MAEKAEKWTIEPYFDDEEDIPERYADDGTYLGTYDQMYWINESDGTQVGTAEDIDDAHLFAASPLMLEVLESAREYISNAVTNCRECGEADAIAKRDQMISAIDAAIAAAKGE
ncbi:MAG: hypothetical protein EBR82_41110 [Caulobacteraceae bacterium]|nr:hypothetical protein [Caulobacteraceae bacterium]